MPLLWSWLTVKHIYKINESTNGHLEKIDYSNSMIWYLYDTLIIGQTRGETLIAWISVIFLLQHLDFLLKLKKKSVLEPTQEIELLGLVSNSVNITLFFIKKLTIQSLETMPVFVVEDRNHLNRICKTDRSQIIYNSSTDSSTADCSFSFFNNRRSQWSQWFQTVLSKSKSSECTYIRETQMVVRKPSPL